MRRSLQIGMATVAASAALAGGVAAATGHDNGHPSKKGNHSEHLVFAGPVQNIVRVNVGDPAAGPGDYAVFRYDVFTQGKNPTKVGDAYVNCVTQFPPAGSQCQGVTRLAGRGDITFQGLAPQDLSEDFTLAITGGTGDFRNVRGELLIQALSPAPLTQSFTYDLIGVR